MKMKEYCKSCPCQGCPFVVCGRGSETCFAGVGDYCQATGRYIEETEEDKKFLEEILDKFNSLCYNIATKKERGKEK